MDGYLRRIFLLNKKLLDVSPLAFYDLHVQKNWVLCINLLMLFSTKIYAEIV